MQLADELARDSAAGIFHDDQYVFSAMNGMGHFEKKLRPISLKLISFVARR